MEQKCSSVFLAAVSDYVDISLVSCVTGGVTYPSAAGVAGVGSKPPKPGSVNSWSDCLLVVYYSIKSGLEARLKVQTAH